MHVLRRGDLREVDVDGQDRLPAGRGTLRIIDPASYVHNASSTKQNIDASMGLVVLADNYASSKYWYYYEPPGRLSRRRGW